MSSPSSPVKRKEPEAAEAVPTKVEGTAPTEEPAAKQLKPTPSDPAAVRKQVEYYLSDENLKYDKFFHEKISAEAEGWLEMGLVLSCNKMKALRCTKEDVIEALKASKMEIRADGSAIRRPGNAPLPALQERPGREKKGALHAHNGGPLFIFQGVPPEQSWMQLKEKLAEKLPQKTNIWFVSEVTAKSQCFVCTAPFEGQLEFIKELKVEAGGKVLQAELCTGEPLQQGLKMLPRHIRERRDKEQRKRQKERTRPIIIGTQRFVSVAALRGRVREIMNSRSDGESLKSEGTDFKLIKELLAFHPRGAEKSRGLAGIKVAKSTQGENRCFYMVREDGSEEDFSAKKCLDAIEANPPYAPEAAPKRKEPEAGASRDAKEPAAKAAKGDAEATAPSAAQQAPASVETQAGQEKAEAKTEEKTEAKAEEKKAEAEAEAEAKAEATAEGKTETKAEAEAKPEQKSEAKAEVEAKAEEKVATKTEEMAEVKAKESAEAKVSENSEAAAPAGA